MSHGDLYEKAKTTIDELYGDASVSLETIRASLEALIAHTIHMLHMLDADAAALAYGHFPRTDVVARAAGLSSELPEEGAWVDGPDRGWGLFVHHKCTGCNLPFRVWEVEPDRRCPRCGRRPSEQEA